MKPLIVIPLAVGAVLGAIAVALSFAGIPIRPADPIIAGIIASAAGIAGLLPVLRSRRRDAVSIAQLALAGTMLHLLAQITLSVAVIAAHTADSHRAFLLWSLGGYWTSLVALIWQLRRIILAAAIPGKISGIDS